MIEEKLIFFDKEGNQINTKWNAESQVWEADLIFSENSSDTFRTYGLYSFEKIDPFDYLSDKMVLEKWQLFNERGLDYYGSSTQSFKVSKVEPENRDSTFYSKWISGPNFERNFPKGSFLRFESNIFNLGDTNTIYQVVDTKKDAVMIISTQSNSSFYSNWSGSYSNPNSYVGVTVSGVNFLSVGDYRYSDGSTKLSSWSEQYFDKRVFNGRKLTVVNSSKNDGIYTISNKDLKDSEYTEYYFFEDSVDIDDNIIARLTLLTRLPIIYQGNLGLSGSNIFFSSSIGDFLKPGSTFYIPESTLNTSILQVDNVLSFNQILTNRFFSNRDLVVYNGKIYQCIQSYTHSINSPVYPSDTLYWSDSPDYLPLKATVTTENLSGATIQLNNNILIFEGGTYSPENITNTQNIAKFVDKFEDEFLKFGLILSFDGRKLLVKPQYSSKYFDLKFYKNSYLTDITSSEVTYNRNLEVSEELVTEKNRDFSQIFNYNIYFSDIDDFGIEITVNSQIYHQDTVWAYNGLSIDLEKTINLTLKAWRDNHFAELSKLGIVITLSSKWGTAYYDIVNISSFYPNVELIFSVRVGTTAKYDILYYVGEFSRVGPRLGLNLNGQEFAVTSATSSSGYLVKETLDSFVYTWQAYLDQLGVFVVRINDTTLEINTQDITKVRTLVFSTYLNLLPGDSSENFIIKTSGNLGNIITSNALVLGNYLGITASNTQDFYDVNFSLGMPVSLLNSTFTYNNRDYNIINLFRMFMNLSYEGPFWASPCRDTDDIVVTYPDGFTYTYCQPYSNVIGAEFSIGSWTSSFFTGTFSKISSYSLSSQNILSGAIDVLYTPISQKYYVLGNSLESFDAVSKYRLKNITLVGNSGSRFLRNNTYNGYLYVATQFLIYKINTFSDEIVSTFSVQEPYDLEINSSNGDIYVTLTYENDFLIYDKNHTLLKNHDLLQNGRRIEINEVEKKVYATTQTSKLVEIDTQTREVSASYSITSLGRDIFYHRPSSTIIGLANNTIYTVKGGTISTGYPITVNSTGDSYFSYNTDRDVSILMDPSGKLYGFDDELNEVYSSNFASNGRISTNPVDQNFFVGLTNKATVINSLTGLTKYSLTTSANLGANTHNPQRRSVLFLQPSLNKLIEVSVQVVISQTSVIENFQEIAGEYFGSLDQNYVPENTYWVKGREFIRKPRENYDYQASYKTKFIWKWEDPTNTDFFLFDFSGNLLETSGSYSYSGPKPLAEIVLNKKPNRDLSKIKDPKYQQTIFDELYYELPFVNTNTDFSFLPQSQEIFIGFNSKIEGVSSNSLQLLKRDVATFSVTPTIENNNRVDLSLDQLSDKIIGKITLDPNSNENFLQDQNGQPRGLIKNQIIQINLIDITNLKDQYISYNNGINLKILEIYPKQIVVDFLGDPFIPESNVVYDYPSTGFNTFLKTTIFVVDKLIANFNFASQTEIEDPRYAVEISNTGKDLSPEISWIFKEYNIDEQGVDWNFLNPKRKEFLYTRDEIFPYVGSYKAIINSINYFGYNDLILNEYYRNTDTKSQNFGKLFKVEIPDIFDNTIKGWNEKDFLKLNLPNPKYTATKLLNLAYKITDREGNYLLHYSVIEALVKLHGLKLWLAKNVIPITHRILDITGEASFVGTSTITHRNYDVKIIKISEDFSPVDFKINEAYLLPITSGSYVFNVAVDFFTKSFLEDPFSIEIRTYQTFKEWEPFKSYEVGDKVRYFDKLYESVRGNNKINNPRKYENTSQWSELTNYTPGQVVVYDNLAYIYAGTQSIFDYSTFSQTPLVDVNKWTGISYWKKIGLEPIQSINQYKNNLETFNFTVDTTIDPFITLKTISENGRGGYYIVKKNYEIRWLDDKTQPQLILAEDPLPDRTLYTTTTTSTTTACPDNCINYQFCEDINFSWYFCRNDDFTYCIDDLSYCIDDFTYSYTP